MIEIKQVSQAYGTQDTLLHRKTGDSVFRTHHYLSVHFRQNGIDAI